MRQNIECRRIRRPLSKLMLQITTPSDREIAMTRDFDAPRTLLFEALTNLALLKRWFGIFGGWSLAVCEIDLRVGGPFRFVWRNADGMSMGMRGVYREIVVPERVVHTELYDDYPGQSIVTTVLTEQGGKTTLTSTMLYESTEIRDAVLKSGMERGVTASYQNLDQLLASLVDPKPNGGDNLIS
jgi:uncharacterized protein YndB with AHSA1/START domain